MNPRSIPIPDDPKTIAYSGLFLNFKPIRPINMLITAMDCYQNRTFIKVCNPDKCQVYLDLRL